MKQRIFYSFSCGRSSARGIPLIREQYPDADIVFGCANTGLEHVKTWAFGRRVVDHFGVDLVLVEAEIHEGEGNGTRHKLVTWDTLAMKGEPYEAMIRKYGIANESYLHCTRELKTNPMTSYLRSIGWEAGSYLTAPGMRADEPDRISEKAAQLGYIYPLHAAGLDKRDVLDYWLAMPFDLGIEEREGNCVSCHKKSDRKHILNIQRRPEAYEFPARMERQYSMVRPERGPQFFFRGHRSTEQMIRMTEICGEQLDLPIYRADENGGCSESCEAFG